MNKLAISLKNVSIHRRMMLKGLIILLGAGLLGRSFGLLPAGAAEIKKKFEVTKTDAEWRKMLTPEQYRVLRQEWTEPPHENKYNDHKEKGIYHCVGCDQPLFSWRHKYDSRTGWPSFWQPMFSDAVGAKTDWKLLYPRTEVHCARCGGHLGHLFEDGPAPTYLRYCINSAALIFKPSCG
jgi:peptide-methionine (R)-S-oxide reductase